MSPEVAGAVEKLLLHGPGTELSGSLRLLGVLTLLSLVPAMLMLMTSFTRIIIVLSLVRYAIGTPSIPPTSLLLSLALILTSITMSPTLEASWTQGVEPYIANRLDLQEAADATLKPMRTFMFKHTGSKELTLFSEATGHHSYHNRDEVPLGVLISSFATSELRSAFEMGFMILVAFLVIDIVVASFLMAMGMMMVPPMTISLPVKLLVFVLADGWLRVFKSLIAAFR
jgi:flagellar biosynthesis protein FliP